MDYWVNGVNAVHVTDTTQGPNPFPSDAPTTAIAPHAAMLPIEPHVPMLPLP